MNLDDFDAHSLGGKKKIRRRPKEEHHDKSEWLSEEFKARKLSHRRKRRQNEP